MMEYTLIFIFSEDMSRVLLQLKNRGPYPGKLNGVGGKVESIDDHGLASRNCAYREIKEETGLDLSGIEPITFICTLLLQSATMDVFYTTIRPGCDFIQIEDEPLGWYNVSDLCDVMDERLAGDGNVPYFIRLALVHQHSKVYK